jgi:type IV pilus assembly protein PilX
MTGCGARNSDQRGLCQPTTSGPPAWAIADLESNAGLYTEFGDFTSRSFSAGNDGIQPARKPRYVIEVMKTSPSDDDSDNPKTTYRITAMGFGPRADIHVVTQMSVIKEYPVNAPAKISRTGWRLIGNYSDQRLAATH